MNTQNSDNPHRTEFWTKSLRKLMTLIIAIALALVSLSMAIHYGATEEEFYDKTFKQLDSRNKVGLNERDFEAVKDLLIAYVGLKTETFSVRVTLDGQTVDFFNDKERSHMVDVRNLFVLNRNIQLAAIALCLLTYAVGKYVLNQKRLLIDGLILSGLVMLVFMATLGIAATQDFTSIFIKFHEMFFSNELWLLDPATDRMIVLLEEGFFSAIALRIGVYTVLLSSFGTAMGIVLQRNLPK